MLLERGSDALDQTGVVELGRRQVHRDGEGLLGPQLADPCCPATGLRQHERTELVDGARLLGEGDEPVRAEPPVDRVVPAHERFRTHDAAVVDADERLVLDDELAPRHRSRQVGAQGGGLPQLAAQVVVEPHGGPATCRLGGGHGGEGVVHHGGDVAVSGAERSHADARRQLQLERGAGPHRPDRRPELVAERRGGPGPGDRDGEHVAVHPADDGPGPGPVDEGGTDEAQHGVADLGSVHVVDLAEPVEADLGHGAVGATGQAPHPLGEGGDEAGAVRQAGQRVDVLRRRERRPEPFDLGLVDPEVEVRPEARDRVGVPADHDAHRHLGAVGALDPDLPGPPPAGVEGGHELLDLLGGRGHDRAAERTTEQGLLGHADQRHGTPVGRHDDPGLVAGHGGDGELVGHRPAEGGRARGLEVGGDVGDRHHHALDGGVVEHVHGDGLEVPPPVVLGALGTEGDLGAVAGRAEQVGQLLGDPSAVELVDAIQGVLAHDRPLVRRGLVAGALEHGAARVEEEHEVRVRVDDVPQGVELAADGLLGLAQLGDVDVGDEGARTGAGEVAGPQGEPAEAVGAAAGVVHRELPPVRRQHRPDPGRGGVGVRGIGPGGGIADREVVDPHADAAAAGVVGQGRLGPALVVGDDATVAVEHHGHRAGTVERLVEVDAAGVDEAAQSAWPILGAGPVHGVPSRFATDGGDTPAECIDTSEL